MACEIDLQIEKKMQQGRKEIILADSCTSYVGSSGTNYQVYINEM
jgi:hypothetical protein